MGDDTAGTHETTKETTQKTYPSPKADETLNVPFETFWGSYDKKISPEKCRTLWKRLSNKERLDIMAYLPKYKQSQPDKKYRKHPQTFLNNRSWENEIIDSTSKPTWQQKPQSNPQFGTATDPLAVNQHWQNYQPPTNWEENFEKAMAMVASPTNQSNTMIEI